MKFNGLIPELSVTDLASSVKFYIHMLEFRLEYERPEDKFAFLSYGNAQIMLEEKNGNWDTAELLHPLGRGINFQISTDNAPDLAQRLKDHGILLFRDVFESRYECGGQTVTETEFLVQDPDGYLLRFSQTDRIAADAGEAPLDEIKKSGNAFYVGEKPDSAEARITFVPSADGRIVIDRTYVSEVLRGRGMGRRLVNSVVEYARAENLKIIPECPYARKVLLGDGGYEDVLV